MTCRMDDYLGAYVLAALEPDEDQAVHAHLTGCRACREEVSSLADTASLLALLTIQDIDEIYGPEPVAADPASADPVSARRRPRRRWAVLAVAAAVLIAGTAVADVQVFSGGPVPSPPGVVQVVDPTTHVRAAVTMTGRIWGTQLHLALAGADPSGWCSLVAHSRNGQSETAATWVADRTGAASVDGATAIPVSQLTELDVLTASGALLARISVPHHNR